MAEEVIVLARSRWWNLSEAAAVTEEVIVPAPEVVTEPAEVVAEAAVVAEEVIVPAPEVVVESAEVIAEVAVRQRK